LSELSDETSARLHDYLDAKVTVYYAMGAYQDTGRVTLMNEHWVELTKDNGQRLLMPHVAIRILSLQEPAKKRGEAGVLLRPASSPNGTRSIGDE
jgi:hypothetical protein